MQWRTRAHQCRVPRRQSTSQTTASTLRSVRPQGARNLGNVQDGYRSRRVQRRKRGHGLDLNWHRGVADGVRAQRRSAVHDAVTDGLGRRPITCGQPTGEVSHGVELTHLQRFDLADQHVVQPELQRRRAAVQRQRDHALPSQRQSRTSGRSSPCPAMSAASLRDSGKRSLGRETVAVFGRARERPLLRTPTRFTAPAKVKFQGRPVARREIRRRLLRVDQRRSGC